MLRHPFVVLVGPVGVGKNSIIHRAEASNPLLRFVPSLSTRPMRAGEAEGAPYNFVSVGEFLSLSEAGALLEWAQVGENYYGVSRSAVDRVRDEGRIPITDVDFLGLHNLLLQPELPLISVYVASPSAAETQRRILRRGSMSSAEVSTRLRRATIEAKAVTLCDFAIVNDDLAHTVRMLLDLIDAAISREQLLNSQNSSATQNRSFVEFRVMPPGAPEGSCDNADFVLPLFPCAFGEPMESSLERLLALLFLASEKELSPSDFAIHSANLSEERTKNGGTTRVISALVRCARTVNVRDFQAASAGLSIALRKAPIE